MSALAKIHIAKKELNLHEDDYRAILLRVTGQKSAKGLSIAQAGALIDEFRKMGWSPKVIAGGKSRSSAKDLQAKNRKMADFDSAKKARALWVSLWQLGAIFDNGEDALEAFAKRQLKCERFVWADQQQMYKLIEALKAMAERHGWSQDIAGLKGVYILKRLKVNLIIAQYRKLGRTMPDVSLKTLEWLTDHARDLGVEIRAEIKKGFLK